MTPEQLLRIMPQAGRQADLFAPHLVEAMARYNITGIARQASFLSQIGVESAELTRTSENLNYSAERLMAVWPSRFPTMAQTIGYARNAVALANKVYANRIGNGAPETGDGWRYRGRGLIQLTGKANYEKCGAAIGFNLVENPQFLESPALASLSAAWFWHANGLNELADAGDQAAVTRRINGGVHGLAQRKAMFELAKKVFT
jgi:putative chitinase